MSHNSMSAEPDCCRTLPDISSKSPLDYEELYQLGYQQAQQDFAVTQLLDRLKTYSDCSFDATSVDLNPSEADALATILIQTLTTHLNGQLLAAYLAVMRGTNLDRSNHFSNLQIPPPTINLPSVFPNVEMPRFLYGDRLCWIADQETTDRGIVIGRFYRFAAHQCKWHWCYLIWLGPDSPSSAWVKTDLAWEDDLQVCHPFPVHDLMEC